MTESPKPPKPSPNLYERIRARFEPFGGVDDLELPPREPARDPPDFDTADYDRPPTDLSGGPDGALVTPPDRLQKAWAGAKRRGLDAMAVDEINTEIDAVRAGRPAGRREDDA